MFFKLILENSNSDRIDMTTTANQYMTSRVEGLDLSGFIGRPVYTHGISAVAMAYREQIREDFLDLCRNAKEADDGSETLDSRQLI